MIEPSPLTTDTAGARVASVRAARRMAARIESMREARIQRQLADVDRATGALGTSPGCAAPVLERAAPVEIRPASEESSRLRRCGAFAALATATGALLIMGYRKLTGPNQSGA